MSAGIVYDGVPGNGGTLFRGMKFWVSRRTPERSTILQRIQSNGGEVVILEKNADYLIGDPIKWQNTPHGAYSWQWITESVKEGKLVDKEEYRVNKPESAPRPVGAVPNKLTRTAYTAEDDRILLDWVKSHDNPNGNAIYKELELKCPRHTWQSWRERYVKKLKHLHQGAQNDGGNSSIPNAVAPNTAAPVPAQSTASARQTPRPSQTETPRGSRAISVPSTPKSTRNRFTKEEDDLLTEYVLQAKSEGKRIHGNVIYGEFAQDFPQHTAQSWRDRWVKHLGPARKKDVAVEESPMSSMSSVSQTNHKADQARKAAKARLAALPPGPTISSPENDVLSEAEGSTVNEPTRAMASHEAGVVEPGRQSVDQPQVEEETVDNDAQQPNLPLESEHQLDFQASGSTQASSIMNEEEFNSSLQMYWTSAQEVGDLQSQLEWSPTIQGHNFQLWDLWVAVKSQKVDSAERDWQQISDDLGIDWLDYPNAPDEVRQCWEKNLETFEEAMHDIEAMQDIADDDDGEDQDEDDLSEHAEGHIDNQLPSPSFNSSPPTQPSKKRDIENVLSSDNMLYHDSIRKRARLSRGVEIPSTPDNRSGTAHLRTAVSASVSPSDRRYSNLPKSSRAANSEPKGQQEEDMEMEDEVPELPTLPNAVRTVVEPETQDFGFEPQAPSIVLSSQIGEAEEESQETFTPSQQLRLESDARLSEREHATPTPKPKNRIVKPPFHIDDSEDEGQPTPKPRFGKGVNPLLSSPRKASSPRKVVVAKPTGVTRGRRSLPASFRERAAVRQGQRKSMPGPSRQAGESSTRNRESLPLPQSRSAKLESVVDYYVSLGYPEQIARRALEATSWVRGLAGELMELMKKGEPLPTNWEGVWTPRDDEGLKLVDSHDPPADAKAARKRERELNRLKNKHTDRYMELRRRWFVSKEEMGK